MNAIFLTSINNIRAIAIIFIIAGHCIDYADFKIDSVSERVLANLILGGSHLFVFISGFLFHHVYYENFSYQNFIKKKIRNILFPYLFISFIPILYFVFSWRGPHTSFIILDKSDLWTRYIYPILWYLYTGKINSVYWYIVFIMIIFLLQPLCIRYIKLKPLQQTFILVTFYSISIFIHRPLDNLNVIQSVVYFTPVYLFGITASIYRQKFFYFLRNKAILFLLTAILLAFIQAIYYPGFGTLQKDFFRPALPDIIMIQKFFLILFLFSFFHKYESTSIRALNLLASTSFALFFIHPFVITLLYKVESTFNFNNPGLPEIFWAAIIFFIVISISLLLAKFIKMIFRERSRVLIGW